MKERELRLYKPHAGQLQMHESKKRFVIGVWGRQSGKSTWASNHMIKKTWEMPGSFHWLLEPTFNQAKTQYRRTVSSLFNCPEVMLKKNQTELRVKLLQQGTMEFKSGETFDNLRGATLNGSIIDEVRDQNPDLWPLVIRPMLTTTKGWGSFIGTPNGFDNFYEMVEMAKENPDEWDVFYHPSTINPLFTLEEYEASRRTMTDKQFRQEILAEFLDLMSGRAYYAFSELNINPVSPWAQPGCEFMDSRKPIVLGLDFNLNPMAWALGQRANRRWHWFDEIHIPESNTPDATQELVRRLIELRNQGFIKCEPNIIICGDAAGNSKNTKSAGKSDYDILKAGLDKAGFTYDDQTPEANPPVKDRVNAVNALCKSADGGREMTISPKCKFLIRDLRKVTWKEGTGGLDKNKDLTLTHLSDAIGYPIHKLTPVPDVGGGVGKLVVINY